jgi:DNA mismatch repair protein MSH6
MRGVNFIPNDFQLGTNEATLMLLTGPNMGGKSTLLRMTCIIAILA